MHVVILGWECRAEALFTLVSKAGFYLYSIFPAFLFFSGLTFRMGKTHKTPLEKLLWLRILIVKLAMAVLGPHHKYGWEVVWWYCLVLVLIALWVHEQKTLYLFLGRKVQGSRHLRGQPVSLHERWQIEKLLSELRRRQRREDHASPRNQSKQKVEI